MAFNQSLRTDTPSGTTTIKTLDTEIRDGTKEAIRERLAVDHNMPVSNNTVDATDAGKHSKVTLLDLGGNPTVAANQGVVFGKIVSGVLELYYKDQTHGEIQLTTGGVLNVGVDGTSLQYSGGVLAIKDGGVTGAKLAAGAVDDSSLQISGNVLSVKSGGIIEGMLHDDSVVHSKLKEPVAGENSYFCGMAMIAAGSYVGDGGASKNVYVFGDTYNHIISMAMWGAPGGTGVGINVIKTSIGKVAWKDDGGESTAIALNGHYFTVSGDLNTAGVAYYWQAIGRWQD